MYETWEDFIAGEKELDLTGFDVVNHKAYIKLTTVEEETEDGVIRKVGKQWCIFSEKGKRLGCYSSRPAAEKRLKQIEMFKHMKSGLEVAAFYCYCPVCGAYFFSSRRCDNSLCPECRDPDRDNVEVMGEF